MMYRGRDVGCAPFVLGWPLSRSIQQSGGCACSPQNVQGKRPGTSTATQPGLKHFCLGAAPLCIDASPSLAVSIEESHRERVLKNSQIVSAISISLFWLPRTRFRNRPTLAARLGSVWPAPRIS